MTQSPHTVVAKASFWPRQAQRKCPPKCDTDGQPGIAMRAPKPKIFISLDWNDICNRNSNSRLKFSITASLKTVFSGDCVMQQQPTILPLKPFPAVRRCRNHFATLFRTRHGRKPHVCRWKFDDIYQISEDTFFPVWVAVLPFAVVDRRRRHSGTLS